LKFQILNFGLLIGSCDSRIAFTADPKTIHEITRTDTKKL
jgi:hypothetical protein